MTRQQSFLKDILDHPEDLSIRLIYADWLDDHGDEADQARAELIRVQCRMTELSRDNPAWGECHLRAEELQRQHRRHWNGPLHEMLHRGGLVHVVRSRRGQIMPWRYQRGFVEALHVEVQTFFPYAPLLLSLGPIQGLKFWNARLFLQQLAACPHLARIRLLGLEDNDLTVSALLQLAHSPYLTGLSHLYLGGNPINPGEWVAVTRAFPQARLHYHHEADW